MMTLRHVWQEVCRNPLYALIYVFGTAIALGSTTMMIAIMNSSVAPIYPEYKRNNTGYISQIYLDDNRYGINYQWQLSYEAVRDYIYTLKDVDYVTAHTNNWDKVYAQSASGGLDVPLVHAGVDPSFFDVFSFDFLAGRPFSQAEFDSGQPVAILGDRSAKEIFGNVAPEELVGRPLSLGFREYRIVGIVLEATEAEETSYAGVYYPYTSQKGYDEMKNEAPFIGDFEVAVVSDNLESVRRQLSDIASRYNSSQKDFTVNFDGQPRSHIVDKLIGKDSEETSTLGAVFLSFGLMILGLMIVPSLNLSGLIAGRMETRVCEMGVRKSFGASRGTLMRRVLLENLILTAVGTIAGYIIAYALLRSGVGLVFSEAESSEMSHGMMIAPAVFLGGALLCFILNIVSGLIPIHNSLRRPIVQSLKEK